ncbi:MAG TPA: tyrosine-type recombinase/integrase, partial [Candidatus Angelobacter sp.]|nr:tyrosine-type recombinase/integrase [Candidatus Angelobacter sp.]
MAILKEQSQESAGLIAPKKMREAAQILLKAHLASYVRELISKGRAARYAHNVETAFENLMQECRWEHFKDVTAESFLAWRQSQTKAPKTLNEYLGAARAFLKWLVRLGYLPHNPLTNVEPVRVQGRQKRTRRAYTPEEIQKLLGIAGERYPVYLMAVLTGIRRGELRKLRWIDVSLDGAAPVVTIRASVSKNHREARLPLHPDLVEALKELRPADSQPEDLIFKGLMPRTNRFRADLKAAEIEWQDSGNGRLDFHCFRVTYCTELAPLTPSERVRMELMRHHDPRLTAETYTDAKRLPLADAVEKLAFHRAKEPATPDTKYTAIDTQVDAQTGVFSSPAVSSPVTNAKIANHVKTRINTGGKSLPVTVSHDES